MKRLSLAAALGSRVASANTLEVLPLITTLEEETLPLREDLAMVEFMDREVVLGLAAETEEKYFVAPPPAHWYPPTDNELEFLSCP